MKTVQLTTMKAVAKQLESCKLYHGNRPTSKTDGHTLLQFVRLVFDHNHCCDQRDRLQDHEILALVCEEFNDSRYNDLGRNYVTVWRNMFNSGRMHHVTATKRDFIAFRVNTRLQFTKSTSLTRPLTLDQLYKAYEDQNFQLPLELINEIKSYS